MSDHAAGISEDNKPPSPAPANAVGIAQPVTQPTADTAPAPDPTGQGGGNTQSKDGDNFLKDEYLFLQKAYEDFDQKLIAIKGWSVTASLAGLVLGFQYKTPTIWLLAFGSALVFWGVETLWKSFQYAYRKRICTIESYFRQQGNKENLPPFQIYTAWYEGYNNPGTHRPGEEKITKNQQLWKIARTPGIMLPHAVIAVAALLLFAVFRNAWNEMPSGGVPQNIQTTSPSPTPLENPNFPRSNKRNSGSPAPSSNSQATTGLKPALPGTPSASPTLSPKNGKP